MVLDILAIVPPTPKNPESQVLNETAVSLVWYTPDSPNGIILEYQVIYYGYKPQSDTRKRVGDLTQLFMLCL